VKKKEKKKEKKENKRSGDFDVLMK